MRVSLDLPRDALSLPVCCHLVGPALRALCLERPWAAEIEQAVIAAVEVMALRAGDDPEQSCRLTLDFHPDRLCLGVADTGEGLLREALEESEPEAGENSALSIMDRAADQLTFWTTPAGGSHLRGEFWFSPVSSSLAPP